MKPVVLLLPVVFFLLAATSSAEMYKWVDEHGTVTFKDTPPPKKKKRVKVKVYTDDGVASAPVSQSVNAKSSGRKSPSKSSSKSSEKPRFTGTIEMYVTDWCPVCKTAERYIAGKNYSYVKYDIEKDDSAKQRYAELGGRGVPLIMVGSKKMSGFSAEALEEYMGNK